MEPGKFEELLTKMAERNEQQQNQIAGLIETIKHMPGIQNPVSVQVQAAEINPAVVRAEKVQRLSTNVRKSNRLKLFKSCKDSDVRLFIKKFKGENDTLKQEVGIANDLSRDEYVPIFRACLDFTVIERLEQVFKTNPADIKTWANITIKDLDKFMIEEFGVKHTDVANVLKQFGPSRLTKSPDQSVQDFYFEWCQNIPEILKPNTDQEFKKFADLVHRAMYYILE